MLKSFFNLLFYYEDGSEVWCIDMMKVAPRYCASIIQSFLNRLRQNCAYTGSDDLLSILVNFDKPKSTPVLGLAAYFRCRSMVKGMPVREVLAEVKDFWFTHDGVEIG